jgi:hypothetical protein
MKSFGARKQVLFMVPPLKKAFSNLLDSVLDEPLVSQLKNSHTLQAYALAEANNFKTVIRVQVSRLFKTELDNLIDSLQLFHLLQHIPAGELTGEHLELIFDDRDKAAAVFREYESRNPQTL